MNSVADKHGYEKETFNVRLNSPVSQKGFKMELNTNHNLNVNLSGNIGYNKYQQTPSVTSHATYSRQSQKTISQNNLFSDEKNLQNSNGNIVNTVNSNVMNNNIN